MSKPSTENSRKFFITQKGMKVTITGSRFKVKKTLYQLNGNSPGIAFSIILQHAVPYVSPHWTIGAIGFHLRCLQPFCLPLIRWWQMTFWESYFFVSGFIWHGLERKRNMQSKIITAQGEKKCAGLVRTTEYVSQIVSCAQPRPISIWK